MKKIVILLTITLFAASISVSAQWFSIGAKGGYSTTLEQNNSFKNIFNVKSNLQNGFHLGIYARMGRTWYAQPEVLFNYYNYKNSLNYENSKIHDNKKYQINTIDVPILLGTHLINTNLFKMRAMVGPKFSFNIGSTVTDTFNDMEKFPGLHFKKYTTEIQKGVETGLAGTQSNLLRIPAYFLDADDLAVLLHVNHPTQLPALSKALQLVRIFTSSDPKAEDYKNDIIAKTLLDILSSGKTSTQMRDQVISVLTSYNTETLNLNSVIRQPGYDRTFRQCLLIDDQGKINAMNLVVDFLQRFVQVDIDEIQLKGDATYTLSDLYFALEFALVNEGAFTSEAAFDRNNILKSRLQSIINSDQAKYFEFDEFISKHDYVEEFFSTGEFGETAQLVDINLAYIDDKFAKVLTKIYSKLFFEFTTTLEQRGSFSIHIVLEEAHRYVQNDTDLDIIGYNIFDRITKEGRKYGTILGFITQRPAELSKTALSQCSNFVVFRLFYPEDLEMLKVFLLT